MFEHEVIDVVDARKVKEMVAKKSSQLMGSVSGATKLPPHKHCRICQEAISVKAEPRVCKNPACIEQNQKDEKNQKTGKNRKNWCSNPTLLSYRFFDGF